METKNTPAQDAYETLKQRQPKLVKTITELVKKGKSPFEIRKHVLKLTGQPYLSSLASMTAEYIKSAKCRTE